MKKPEWIGHVGNCIPMKLFSYFWGIPLCAPGQEESYHMHHYKDKVTQGQAFHIQSTETLHTCLYLKERSGVSQPLAPCLRLPSIVSRNKIIWYNLDWICHFFLTNSTWQTQTTGLWVDGLQTIALSVCFSHDVDRRLSSSLLTAVYTYCWTVTWNCQCLNATVSH